MQDTPEIARIRAALEHESDDLEWACQPHNMTSVLSHIDQQAAEIARLKSLITRAHSAKGRYHSQLAMCDLYDAIGLPNARPIKETP